MKRVLFLAALLFSSAAIAGAQEQYNQYGVKVDIDPLQAEAQDGILVLRSKNNSGYKIWFDNRVQTDAAVFFGEPEWADPIGSGFSIRRARFAVKAQIDKNWYGEVDMDMADGTFELKDAIIRYTGLEHWQFQVGNFKEIFSMQRNNSSRYLLFMERPMVCSALAPSRHLGLNVNYYNNGIFANLGIHGQAIAGAYYDDGERYYLEENNKTIGADEKPSFTLKAVWQPGWDKDSWGLHVGGAFSYRFPKTSDEKYGMARYSSRNTTSINRKKYIDTGDFAFDHALLYTAELAGYWKGLRAEAVWMGNTTYVPNAAGDAFDTKNFSGWYVQAGYLLFGGAQRYDGAGAKFTRVKRGQNWGDIELCGRIEQVDLNADKNSPTKLLMGGSSMAYSLGLNYYITDHVKVQLNYQYTDNDRWAAGKGNKFYCGVKEDGTPTKTPTLTGKGKAGVDYNMVSMRFEIDF
ncbi:MAG: hypothetical protein J5835_04915 [Bacteroidales bacterium]|nr:hypothetical protein [Bacteroidales bacterium]